MTHAIGSIEHVALLGVAAAGEKGVPMDALLSNEHLLGQCGVGNGPVSLLVENGMSKSQAERTMRDPVGMRKAIADYFEHVVRHLIDRGAIVDDDGILRIGKLPRGYDPVKEAKTRAEGITRLNIVAARRKAKGWSNYTNALDHNVVAQMAETMTRKGWPKGHTVLLDSEGFVADGKHHVAAAELVGIDWKQHTKVIHDEIKLWEEVESRNIDRWHGKPSEVAKVRASFIALRADLSVGARLEEIRRTFPNTSERTQQRVTAETKKALKAEVAAQIKEKAAEGKTQRQIASEVGVSVGTVNSAVKRSETASVAETEQPPAPKVVGTCCVCTGDITENDKVAEILRPVEGFLFGGTKSGGGYNAIKGVVERTGEIAHSDCMSRDAQIAHRHP